MHVSVKRLAFSGLMLAFTEILLTLSGILEFNTLFLLAAASFFIGIMIREIGMGNGAAFYGASVLQGLLLAPNKLYCVTYAFMGFYVLAAELAFRLLGKIPFTDGAKGAFGGRGLNSQNEPIGRESRGDREERRGRSALPGAKARRIWFWGCKFLIFNCLYLPALFLLPRMLFPGGIERKWLPAAALLGQAALVIYDLAYEYFMRDIWEKLRRRTGLGREGF